MALRSSCGLFLLGFELLQAHRVVAEGLRRARRVADFVTASGVGDVEIALAARQAQQDGGDAADRTADGQHPEHRVAAENDGYE